MNNFNIIFIHGWLFDSRIWCNFDKLFTKNHNVKKINLPGYGSNIEKNLNHRDYCKQVFKAIDSPSIIICWSYGGLLAIKECVNNYPNIKKIILINSNPYIFSNTSESFLNKNNIKNLKKGLEINRYKTIQKFFFECVKNSKFAKNEYKFLKENFLIDSLPENSVLTDGLEYLSESNNSKLLMETKKEVLMINGKNDHFIEPKLPSNKTYKNISVRIIDNMGHMPFISFKNEIYNAISSFI